MELNNQTSKKVYVQLLVETMTKKEVVLKCLLELTAQQDHILSSKNFNEEVFTQNIDEKELQLKELTRIDDGFEHIYESVQSVLKLEAARYAGEIVLLKEKVTGIMDLSMKILDLEKKNKGKMEKLFATKRNDIKEFRVSSQMATNYYKTMAQQQDNPSFLYDKKN